MARPISDLEYALSEQKAQANVLTPAGLGKMTVLQSTKIELDKAKCEVARLEELVDLLEANPVIEKVLNLLRHY